MEREEYQKLEKYLKSYLSAEEEARMYSEKYCMIMEQGKAVKSLVMSSAPTSCSGPSDLSAYSTKVDDVKRQMMRGWDVANQRMLDIDRLISRLDSWEEKSILKSVYIMGYDLKFLQKIGRSYSKVKRLHHDGMENLKKLLESDNTLCDQWQQGIGTEKLIKELKNRDAASVAEFSKGKLDLICYALQLYIDSQIMAAGEEQIVPANNIYRIHDLAGNILAEGTKRELCEKFGIAPKLDFVRYASEKTVYHERYTISKVERQKDIELEKLMHEWDEVCMRLRRS